MSVTKEQLGEWERLAKETGDPSFRFVMEARQAIPALVQRVRELERVAEAAHDLSRRVTGDRAHLKRLDAELKGAGYE